MTSGLLFNFSPENFPELDLAVLKVAWIGEIPKDQMFPDFVVLDDKSAKENQELVAVGGECCASTPCGRI